jgi:hypothetical protein
VVAEHATLLGASSLGLLRELFDAAAVGSTAGDSVAAAQDSELPSPTRPAGQVRGARAGQWTETAPLAVSAPLARQQLPSMCCSLLAVTRQSLLLAPLPPPHTPQRQSAFMLSSVGARFRRQLQGLMATLDECQPHYIRCASAGSCKA